MVRSVGYRVRTRRLFRKPLRKRGLVPLGYLLRNYKTGDNVVINIEPSIQKGMPHRRYHGKLGRVKEKRGRAYVVDVDEGGKLRQIIANPIHLKPHTS